MSGEFLALAIEATPLTGSIRLNVGVEEDDPMDSECACCGVAFSSAEVARAPSMFGICPGCLLGILEVSTWIGEERDSNQGAPVVGARPCRIAKVSVRNVRGHSPQRRLH
jgi:hypothetical protein